MTLLGTLVDSKTLPPPGAARVRGTASRTVALCLACVRLLQTNLLLSVELVTSCWSEASLLSFLAHSWTGQARIRNIR